MLRLGPTALALAFATASMTGCVITSDDGDSDFTISNRSDYTLVDIRLTEVDRASWGPNLLEGDVLLPGESLTIVDIECGTYDVQVVDELDTPCELYDVDLCFDSDGWTITNLTLELCEFGG